MTDQPRKPGRPATGTNPVHCVRVPNPRWQTASERAKAIGLDQTKLVNGLLAWFNREPGAKLPRRPD